MILNEEVPEFTIWDCIKKSIVLEGFMERLLKNQ